MTDALVRGHSSSDMANALKNWIKSHGDSWLDDLVEEKKVIANTCGYLVSLKYDQVNSPMADPVVRECRGAVVDIRDGKILAHPFDKFWNLGDPLADEIDWSTAYAQDKLDGSLMVVYWDPTMFDIGGSWRVASSGHPTAGGSYGKDATKTFADVFWDTWEEHHMLAPPYRCITYMFELTAPDNRIVCKYDVRRVTFLGARNLDVGVEVSRDLCVKWAAEANWPIVTHGKVTSAAGVQLMVRDIDPLKNEGVVVVDHCHRRVKVKNARYVQLHHMLGVGASAERVVDLWKTGEIGELLATLPELAPEITRHLEKLDLVAGHASWLTREAHQQAVVAPDGDYSKAVRKAFAARVKDSPFSSLCFKLFGNINFSFADVHAALRQLSTAAIVRMMEVA